MTKEIFNLIDCPRDCEMCVGLQVSANGSTIELQQNADRYIVRTRGGNEAHGNCSHYQECYKEVVMEGVQRRKPAEIK